MQRYVNSTIDVILERTADELIGGILVALLLSLAVAGGFALFKRKIADTTTLITCLALVMNLVMMTVTAGFVRDTRQGIRGNAGARRTLPPADAPGGDRLATLAKVVFAQADINGDGMLTPEEAAAGADKFVRRETLNTGPVNEMQLRAALRRQGAFPTDRPGPAIADAEAVRNRRESPPQDEDVPSGLPRATPRPTR